MATTTDQTATQRKLVLKASELDTLVSLFAADPQRAVRYQVKAAGILLDYSKSESKIQQIYFLMI